MQSGEGKCGYHYTPSQYFRDNNIYFDTDKYKGAYQCVPKYAPRKHIKSIDSTVFQRFNSTQVRTSTENTHGTQNNASTHGTHYTENTPSFINISIFNHSLSHYDRNTFVSYLNGLFGERTTNELIERYKIGTSKHWSGSTVFWQIDLSGNIRAGKIMLYDQTGHRAKEPFNHITWVHKATNIENYTLKQCLFGEHLLKGNTLHIAVVESEKTAVIASIYLPQFVWLACGQLQGLSVEKCKVLAGKTVFLFPDLKGFEKWNQKAKELQSQLPGTRFIVSDYLERNASEADKEKGNDLADYLIKFDVKDFRRPEKTKWFVDMQGVLRQYEAGEITGDQFLTLQDENWQQSWLTMEEYVTKVNELSIKN